MPPPVVAWARVWVAALLTSAGKASVTVACRARSVAIIRCSSRVLFGFGVEVGLQRGKDGIVHATRAETGRVQCGDADLCGQQQLAVAQDLLVEDHAGLLQLDQGGA